ncbi:MULTISPECIES: NAD(P)-binding domain-containing protein [unclassified Bradyrhizobium]|uniref:NAD(P)-binding domain-containing protein n=1 Tax=unclassified Bradyrhizobium TaxID=2631580 RepID=UPI001BA643D7|nr:MULTISPECIES: NAD(P)-binding domain-containing protein [unclassified Bradyrhizobium]MBR1207916.1 NAD(P)-binding domain-containing protein [Bradyrhizobium sp. AUGA SZCCT0124]MBR1314574.1 NAD(P)-binding domain-containing protein [Bradyrhizobium sp. AUGA SZCCT0051]MBR1342406.1 NAD(P)-binding domain-containing protein [Bradyrhizobium sp. AUGA SZCCT0105]MBR1352636.1 NAD(P)-binding domain-containing protein [Bradyrhizobium sp. AUGA SZCCT0045]
MPDEAIDTLVIGGGQAGLTMSHRLKQRGIAHLVLERRRIAERWRSERWDGLMFQFPNWSVRLPEFAFPHSDPDGFSDTASIIAFIEDYAAFVAPPIRCGVEVTKLRRDADGFLAEIAGGSIAARNVVIATGPYQRPLRPELLREHPGVFQVHASDYKNPAQLPDGAVLVIGAGASGAQITNELIRAGRRVFLSVGRHNRLPRRYRGRDLFWWLAEMGVDETPVEQRGPSRLLPVITGAHGGHTIDFRRFAADGVTLLGRVTAARDGVLEIAPDLATNIADGDAYYATFLGIVDDFIATRGLDHPDDPLARLRLPDPPCLTAPLDTVDLRTERISSVIWATGYGLDLNWIDIPVLDAHGAPRHRHGVSDVPGLYFLGLQWLSKMKSSFLSGVGDDAAVLADHIAARG